MMDNISKAGRNRKQKCQGAKCLTFKDKPPRSGRLDCVLGVVKGWKMGLHNYCELNCGGTDCDAPVRYTVTATKRPAMVAIVETTGEVRWITVKDAAIKTIRAQPFYAPNNLIRGASDD